MLLLPAGIIRRYVIPGPRGPVTAPTGGADLGVGDLVVEQGVQLGGLGGGVAEAPYGLDRVPALISSVAWAWRSWWMSMPTPAAAQ
jgi:hypothetical protein